MNIKNLFINGKKVKIDKSALSEEVVQELGSGGVLLVTDTEGTLDKTYEEIENAFMSGLSVIITLTELGKNSSSAISKNRVISIVTNNEGSEVTYRLTLDHISYYSCTDKSQYPSFGEEVVDHQQVI